MPLIETINEVHCRNCGKKNKVRSFQSNDSINVWVLARCAYCDSKFSYTKSALIPETKKEDDNTPWKDISLLLRNSPKKLNQLLEAT